MSGLGGALIFAILGVIVIVIWNSIIQEQSQPPNCPASTATDLAGGTTIGSGVAVGPVGTQTLVGGTTYNSGSLCRAFAGAVASTGVGYYTAISAAGALYGEESQTTRLILRWLPVIIGLAIFVTVWRKAVGGAT